MKKDILSLILLVLVFSSAFATKHNHTDENEVRYVKKSVELNPQYQQQLRNAEMWQNFMAENPNWFVIFNERNQLPHRAFGAPIPTNDIFSFDKPAQSYYYENKHPAYRIESNKTDQAMNQFRDDNSGTGKGMWEYLGM